MPPPLVSIKALHSPQTQTVSVRDDAPQPVYRLAAGGRYRISVRGTYHYDDRSGHRADAECSTSNGGNTWAARTAGETAGQLDLVALGNHAWRATGTVTNGCSAEHTYRRTVSVETGTPLRMVINDPSRWLGDGSLTVTVVRVA